MKDFEKQLKQVRPKGLSSNERTALWSQIEQGIEVEGYIKAHKDSSNPSLFKKIVALTAGLGLVIGSFGTAAYADTSVPGDFLFPIDVATEKIQIAIASSEKKDKLRVEFANERLEEVKTILAVETDAGAQVEVESTFTQNEAAPFEPVPKVASQPMLHTEDFDTSSKQENIESSFIGLDQIDEKKVKKTNHALLVALSYLEESKDVFIREGNNEKSDAIEGIIGELVVLADSHVEKVQKSILVLEDDEIIADVARLNKATATSSPQSNTKDDKRTEIVSNRNEEVKEKLAVLEERVKIHTARSQERRAPAQAIQKIDAIETIEVQEVIPIRATPAFVSDENEGMHGEVESKSIDVEVDISVSDNDRGEVGEAEVIKIVETVVERVETVKVDTNNEVDSQVVHIDVSNQVTSDEKEVVATVSPLDRTAPSMLRTKVSTTTTSAVFELELDETATAIIQYQKRQISSDTASVVSKRINAEFNKKHIFELVGLTTDTTYSYRFIVKDEFGNTSTSSLKTFTLQKKSTIPTIETVKVELDR